MKTLLSVEYFGSGSLTISPLLMFPISSCAGFGRWARF